MLIYSHTVTPRLQYVVDFLSAYYLCPIKVTTDSEVFLAAPGVKINYSLQSLCSEELRIEPAGLLFDKGVRDQKISCFKHTRGYKAFYKARGHWEFDLFAAVFYLLTRYEEYLPYEKDAYGRYAHENSLAYKEGFLRQPLINLWLEDFRNLLLEKQSLLSAGDEPLEAISHRTKAAAFRPTYDIDIAWSYRNKGRVRNLGGAIRSLLNGDIRAVKERRLVLKGKAQDPFDSYALMDTLHEQYNLRPVYFFHVGQQRNRYDKNISTDNPEFRQLIRDAAAKYPVGLHPSWNSGDDEMVLLKEKGVLEEILGQPVSYSRQHYIRFTLPQTFRCLISAGITHDYSLGYGSVNGFRASIATPFYWYDLKKEEQTALLLHPFAFMDANSFFEQKQTPELSLEELLSYYKQVQEINGQLFTIWHNPFLGTDPLFKGWKETYTRFLEMIHTQE